jgi:hypothetical protein
MADIENKYSLVDALKHMASTIKKNTIANSNIAETITDLNDVLLPGYYFINTSYINKPSGVSEGLLLVFNN